MCTHGTLLLMCCVQECVSQQAWNACNSNMCAVMIDANASSADTGKSAGHEGCTFADDTVCSHAFQTAFYCTCTTAVPHTHVGHEPHIQAGPACWTSILRSLSTQRLTASGHLIQHQLLKLCQQACLVIAECFPGQSSLALIRNVMHGQK